MIHEKYRLICIKADPFLTYNLMKRQMIFLVHVQYALQVLFCSVILVILLVNHLKSSGLQNTSRIYIKMIACNIINFALDILYVICNFGIKDTNRVVFYVVMMLYFISSAVAGVFWLWYVAEEHGIGWFHRSRNIIIAFIPLSLYALLNATSFATHLVFYITPDGMYKRGTAFFLQYLFPYGYIFTASIISFVRAMDKQNFLQKNKYLILSAFILPPTTGAAIQLFVQDLPLLCMGTTILLLIIYLYQQNEKISIDPLTQINNRFQIIHHLTNKIAAYDGKKVLYLLMMDLNLFKKINDNYGHVEGDAALVRVAKVLKKVCYGKDHFIGRYGGDEFILIAELDDGGNADHICKAIHDGIAQANKDAGTKYEISLSIGCAQYTKSYNDIVSFIAAADAELYKIKKARKINR